MKRQYRRTLVSLTAIASTLAGGLTLTPAAPVPAVPAESAEPEPAGVTTDFFTSFEEGQPQPDWENTAETDADGHKRMSGVTGSPSALRARRAAAVLMDDYDTEKAWWPSSWWNSAVATETVIEYMQRSGDESYLPQVDRTFERNQGTFPAGELSGDELWGNFTSRAIDDSEWWALAWVQAYDLTGDQKYLDMAVTIGEFVHDYWDDTCGGGVWWDAERTYKNAVTNGLWVRLTAELHNRIPGDTVWLERSQTGWDWLVGSGMINADWLVNDGLNTQGGGCENNGGRVWSYNQGLAIGAGLELHRATGDPEVLATVRRLADAGTTAPELVTDGILTESCDRAATCSDNSKQFKGIFMRYLDDLNDSLDDAPYQDFVERQAASIWAADRNADDRLGLRWAGGQPNVFDWRTQASALSALLANMSATPPPPTDMRAFVSGGPVNGWTMRPSVGWTGVRALQYSGGHIAEGDAFAYNKVLDVDIPVTHDTELSYVVFPELTANDLSYPSTHAAVDLAFDDGTYLSELGAEDHHGYGLNPQTQGASDSLWPDQWNHKRSSIGAVAAGKTIDRILVGYDAETGPSLFNGWIDDIWVGTRPPLDADRPSDYVLTTRGTNSSSGFSRGNTIPATAVPHGFNFWVPMTNAGSTSWLYEYQRANNADNLPTLQAFTASHEPSPWMGDRQTFQVMPSAQTPTTDRSARALAFQHRNEIAKPHYYGVTFENGMRTEIAPSDHAAMFRFTFTGDTSYVMFDNVDNNGGLTLDPESGVITGYSDVRSGLSNGATRMYVYATFDQPVVAGDKPATGTRSNVFGHLEFDTSSDKTVTMRIATSLISIEQARRNLALEIATDDSFERVRERAQQLWDDKLRVIEVEGATEDQLVTLYSNLYRLYLYPNSAHENVGTAADPVYRHVAQSSTSTLPSGSTETGGDIVDGKVYVNNGFWDTYRTVWSAYSLLSPNHAGELVDGFVQQYRDGGWVSRWSSPGYANLMTGTSSDVSFADAYVKGAAGIDPVDTYNAALKNATVAPPGANPNNTSVGRKGLETSIFRGYTDSAVSEGVSWALEGYINDFGLANQARVLADDPTVSAADRERYLEEHEYFLERARNYVHMFDPATDFFQGRGADGSWKSAPEDYDPRVWGHDHDYTETNGWNFAFHVPHDGQGLANLYGGREALADKLDEFFSTPETGEFPGSYGRIIHEIREARDVRMGQWGFSNQVSHHIPWMYLYAEQPHKTQEIVREVLARMYVGSEIGQGYAGDEDNGETSAWYLFAALGLYPLQVGSENLVIGSPLFTKATVHLDNGAELVVNAPNNSSDNVYVQSLTIDGEPWSKTYVPNSLLADGAVLDFEMGPNPSSWGTGAGDVPPSITDDTDAPRPMQDATGPDRGTPTASGGADVEGLFDNTSATAGTVEGDEPWVEYAFRGGNRQRVDFYTLTSHADDAKLDPSSWVVEGSNDDSTWTVLDERHDETFQWRSQTRPFKLDGPSNFSRYRISFGGSAVALAEVELLSSNKPLATPLSIDVEHAIVLAGEATEVEATVTNASEQPVRGGELTTTVPQGWSVDPETATFGRLASGESTTVVLTVGVPEGTEPDTYPIEVSGTSDRGPGSGAASVTVFGDTIAFCTFTTDEEPWLFQVGGAQSGARNDCDVGARFTDGSRFVTYRFPLRDGVTDTTLTIDMAQQFLVEVSTDGENWVRALEEPRNIRNLSNRQDYGVDLSLLADQNSEFLFVRIGDSRPGDGWGAWISDLRLDLGTG